MHLPELLLTPLQAAVPAAGGTLDLLLRVQAPDQPEGPLNEATPKRLALVVDRSGSMDGEPLEEALRRRRHRRGDRIEAEGEAFLARVHPGFQVLAAGAGWWRVEATGDPATVSERCRQALLRHFAAAASAPSPHG